MKKYKSEKELLEAINRREDIFICEGDFAKKTFKIIMTGKMAKIAGGVFIAIGVVVAAPVILPALGIGGAAAGGAAVGAGGVVSFGSAAAIAPVASGLGAAGAVAGAGVVSSTIGSFMKKNYNAKKLEDGSIMFIRKGYKQ